MTYIYNVNFVPKLSDRKKISPLRREVCKKCFTTQALQYPVHLSLAGGSEIIDYELFEKELKFLCKKLKPITIVSSDKNTTIVSKNFWTGLSFNNTKELTNFQQELENLKNKYSKVKTKLNFIPHITLAFPAKVDKLKPSLNPIQELIIDRITICKRKSNESKYVIHKNYKLGF